MESSTLLQSRFEAKGSEDSSCSGFLYLRSYQLQIMTIFAYSVPVWVPVISLSCLVTLARTFSIMLNKSDESEGILVLFLI